MQAAPLHEGVDDIVRAVVTVAVFFGLAKYLYILRPVSVGKDRGLTDGDKGHIVFRRKLGTAGTAEQLLAGLLKSIIDRLPSQQGYLTAGRAIDLKRRSTHDFQYVRLSRHPAR